MHGFYNSQDALLGHTRLSIIDTSESSSQPFYSHDKRYVMVYNGEFFNYKEHKKELESKGISFHTTGDTEVLLHLYITQGESFLENVNGFFAMAIYDTLEKSLFIARDRFGIKPLFYSSTGGNFIFCIGNESIAAIPY